MRLVCTIKFVPDVDNFKYDYEKNVLIRENVRLLLNPDDVCAVAFALGVKAKQPDTFIEVVTMGPPSVKPYMEDLIRLGVDQGTIISDSCFVGSDTYVTSKILGKYLTDLNMDCLLTGTHAIDGDTSHVPSQLGYILGMSQMSGIVKIHEDEFNSDQAVIEVETETAVTTYEMGLPAILSLTRESKYKLPYVRRQDVNKDVREQLSFISNELLGFSPEAVGLKGSPTRVAKTYTKEFDHKGGRVVKVDEAGIDTVYDFLKDKGFV